MTRLGQRIVDLIDAAGPIPVSEYMALCLSDPQHGYYTTREPFGSGGDFTTAPEISQMFGELVGAWLVATWHALDRPQRPLIAEVGPGRGTLMKDIARTVCKLDADMHDSASFALIETSTRLTEIQKQALQEAGPSFGWHETIDALPRQPLLIVGNELFDAIPVRQYVKTSNGWRERMVGLDDAGNLAFIAGAGSANPSLLPADAVDAADGAIVELAPARTALMQTVAERIARDGGAGLFIDYGYEKPAVGDTLQALLKHTYDDPLAHPGEADLTTHVDFSALAAAALLAGLATHFSTQGEFLLGLGLLERAGSLGAKADQTIRERLSGEVERLAGPDQMGKLFKVLAVAPKGVSLPGYPTKR
ncbi:MAG: class I SAM-dependent methyltransferase [Mesorhizobium sp.]